MSNYAYTPYSTNTSQSAGGGSPYRPPATDYLSNSPLRASQVIPPSSIPSRAIEQPLDTLQSNYVLMAAEVDRLLIMNSLMSKEAEQWRKKYLDLERENRDLKLGGIANPDKDREIQYWKDKNMQTESEYLQKVQNIKAQTEGILREQIEREVKTALQYMEEEKRIMQAQLIDLQRERDNLLRNIPPNDFQIRPSEKDNEIAYWKDQFQNLEASLEPRIRSAIESRLQETIAPILRERDDLARRVNDQERDKRSSPPKGSPSRDTDDRINKLENEKRALVDLVQNYENRVNHLMNDNSSLADRLRGVEEKSFNIKDSLRSKDDLERQIENLNRRIRDYDSVIKDQNNEIERLRRTAQQTPQMESDFNSLNRKLRELENEVDSLRRSDQHKTDDLNRMRAEVDRATAQKNDLENRTHHYEKEKTDYQNSLELLKQKFREFEGKMQLLLEENERLKSEIEGKDRELDNLRHMQGYDRDVSDLKRHLGTLEDKVRDERNDFTRRLQSLEDQLNHEKHEVARLSDLLRAKDSEVESWKHKYHDLEQDTQNYIQKLMNEAEGHFRNRIEQEKNEINSHVGAERQAIEKKLALVEHHLTDRDKEIAHLREENNNLSLQNNKLTIEMNNLRSKIDSLTRESNSRVDEFRRKYENDQKAYLEAELRELQGQLNEKIVGYEQEVNRLKNLIKEHELKQILFCIEIERLYLVNGEFIEEINRITEEINHLLNENDKLNNQLTAAKQNNQDRARYDELINGLRDQVEDSENRIRTLMAENARLSDTSIERLKEINNLKNSFAPRGNEAAKKSTPGSRSQADFNELNLRFENEKSSLEGQMNQLRQALEAGRRENVKLQDINNQRKAENDKLYRELEGQRNSSWATQNAESELRLQKEQYLQSLKEIEEMRKARDFYRQQYDQVSAKLKGAFNERIRDTNVNQNWPQAGYQSPNGMR